jgi:hypothetical protein
MLRPRARSLTLGALVFASTIVACGARTGLDLADTSLEATSEGGAAGCEEGETRACGTETGRCKRGLETCHEGAFGACVGAIGPEAESCNGLDDDCDGVVDQPFGVGQPCDGPDADLCLDDVMTCAGCSRGADNVELCNGVDDNCNGVIDADCEVGDCKPQLEVTGSTPSSPSCIDFPVDAGSTGVIEFPCGGGPVTATLGSVPFTGSVVNGVVSLDGEATVIGPDTCIWKTTHHIGGSLYAGELTYTYSEAIVVPQPGPKLCWIPCTEEGVVTLRWGT